jgi:AcrR family transcriptional regulator
MPPRRSSATDTVSRTALLDATEEIMLEEGYAAVSSRRVAARARLDSAVVYYYFRTMDDLFIEVFRRSEERAFRRREEALASSQPLWGLWEVSQDQIDTALFLEFYALANHRKAIRAEISSGSERFRVRQIEMLSKALKRHPAYPENWSPEGLVVLVNGVANYLQLQIAFGNTLGHSKAIRMIEGLIRQVEGDREVKSGD